MSSLYEERVSEMNEERDASLMWMGIGFGLFVVLIGIAVYFSYRWSQKKYTEWQEEGDAKKNELTRPYRQILDDPNASPADKQRAQEMISNLELQMYKARQRNRHMHNYNSMDNHPFP